MVREAANPSSGHPYHHGNLREALIEAGVELARIGGPNAVLLRAASRAAGASHNAAYRHFANQEDLLAVVGQRCMSQLGLLMIERMSLVITRGPVRRAQARLEAIGRAYIDFARTEPGWFRTAFSAARPHPADESSAERAHTHVADSTHITNPYDVLSAQLDDLVEVGVLPKRRRVGAEYAAWSAVHGISSLVLDGPLRELPEPEIERAISTVLALIARGLA
ncbi:MAG TPA: TetR-like C-terminal domain-containing protein [Acidothermaceae bacterium]|jgi:AcrR family transcriptional regulator|nr:TetR-like C-terminal domain-containing protein [Acidothermaceae bacterium]